MRRIIIGVLLLTLAACASTELTAVTGKSVAAAVVSLTLAERLALVYTKLPRCSAVVTKICSTQGTVDKLKELDQKAFDAVVAARKNQALIADAWTAISAFQAVIP